MEKTILTAGQQRLVDAIANSDYVTHLFYFTGGTALSEFYLRHRLSEDLDFFCETPFDSLILQSELKRIFQTLKVSAVEFQSLHAQQTYFVTMDAERIKLDFAYFPFEHLGVFEKKGKLRVASMIDIAVNKIQAIISRKRGRDFLDLYLLMKKLNISIDELTKQYRMKFDMTIPKSECAKHFLGVLESVDQPKFLGTTTWKEVEEWFIQQAKELGNIS